MSRDWPAGWEDPEDAELDAAEFDGEDDVRLSEVAAFLATVPAPVLPGAIESRIVAALAAESAARAQDSPVRVPEPDAPRILRPRPTPARARVRRRHPDRVRPAFFDRIRPAMVAGPLVACLLFAGLGYVISLAGGQSSSSSAPSAESSAAAGPVAGPQYNGSSGSRAAAGSGGSGEGFAVTTSGTDYRQATLAVQVRAVIAAAKKESTPAVPSAAASSSGPVSVPAGSSAAASSAAASASASSFAGHIASLAGLPKSLRGCVVHFTGEAAPALIDRARYQGTPAYVIASASHVWVVGLSCTAAHPDLIASAPLGS